MATVRLFCRLSKSLKDGSLPIVLRMQHLKNPVCYIRVKGISASNIYEWDKDLARFNTKRKDYKKLNLVLNEIEVKADNIMIKLLNQNTFSYQKFKDEYYGSNINDMVIESFKQKIAELTNLKKYGTAEAYTASKNAVSGFTNSNSLVFSDIDFRWLSKLENHLRLKGNGGNTISYKIRSLRALHYNYCNNANIPLPTAYSRFKVGRLSTPTAKRSLTKGELKRFIDHEPTTAKEILAKDIFMFSFLTRGMNIADISTLKLSHIVGNTLTYTRAKTGKVFNISINDDIFEIIERNKGEVFIFPVLNPKHKNTKYSIRLFTKNVNANLNRIAKSLKIAKITTYYARHTFAQLSLESGISKDLISKSLGHNDNSTVDIYLRDYSDKKLNSISSNIISSL